MTDEWGAGYCLKKQLIFNTTFHASLSAPTREYRCLCASHVICLMRRNEDRWVNLVARELITVCVQYAACARVWRSDVSVVSVWVETHFHNGLRGVAKSCGRVHTLGKTRESQRCTLPSHLTRWTRWMTERETVDQMKWRTGSGHLVLTRLPFAMFLPHGLDISKLTCPQWQHQADFQQAWRVPSNLAWRYASISCLPPDTKQKRRANILHNVGGPIWSQNFDLVMALHEKSGGHPCH